MNRNCQSCGIKLTAKPGRAYQQCYPCYMSDKSFRLYGTRDWTATPLVYVTMAFKRGYRRGLQDGLACPSRPSAAPDPAAQEIIDCIPQLIRHCHPDMHGNSPASNKITQVLLRLRDIQRKKND
jgi:hypothetical protein